MKKVIRKPSRFILQNVLEGEECVIHILNEDDYLVTYNLSNQLRKINLQEVIIFETRTTPELKLEHTRRTKEVVEKILLLDEIYHDCTFLFLFRKGSLYLLSYSYNEAPYTYSLVLHLSKLLELKKCRPNWSGLYSTQVLSVFYEDVFIQKK